MPDPTPDISLLTSPAAANPAGAGNVFRRAAWLLPVGILAGFGLLFLLLFRDRLLPAKEVRVAPALVIEETLAVAETGGARAAAGRLLFQASGWIEPSPLPTRAAALQDGVIDEVHVLEGQAVEKGGLIATLVDADTRLALEMAEAELLMAKADLDAHCAGVNVMLQKLEEEKAGLVSDQADLDEAVDRLRRIENTSLANYGEAERVAARLKLKRQEAAVAGRKARIDGISEDFNRIAYETLAMSGKVRAAETALAKEKLAHERTRIVSPIDGRVLRLLAAPGQKKMLVMDDEDSSSVAILYDPVKLQVRVDVPLADAAGLGVGQRVKIHCNLLPDRTFEGEVLRIAGEADVQRNTLQAKVAIHDPDERLRPEMLCRVEFLETAAVGSRETAGLSLYVPEAAIEDGGGVWIYDPATGRAERRAVTPAAEVRDGHRRIEEGIRAGERVILDPEGLRPGQRVIPEITKP